MATKKRNNIDTGKSGKKGGKGFLGLPSWKSLKFFGKVWRVILIAVVAFFVLSIGTVVLYKYINPPLTPLMIQRFFQQIGDSERSINFERNYVSIDDISPNLITAVVYSEDGLFMYHKGYDVKQIKLSYKENKKGQRIRGGSTISMQTAKNAFLPHSRTYLRKAFEFYFTQLIEWIWGKKRIMEVYLNIIEYGDGIYGCEAASQHYFGHSCKKMTRNEAAQLAVSLPGPLKMNPDKSGPYFRKQTKVVEERFKWGKIDIDMPEEKRKAKSKKQETLFDLFIWFITGRK